MKIPAYVARVADCVKGADVRVCTAFGLRYKIENENVSVRLNHAYGVIVIRNPSKTQVMLAPRYTHDELIAKLSEKK